MEQAGARPEPLGTARGEAPKNAVEGPSRTLTVTDLKDGRPDTDDLWRHTLVDDMCPKGCGRALAKTRFGELVHRSETDYNRCYAMRLQRLRQEVALADVKSVSEPSLPIYIDPQPDTPPA